MTAGPEDDYAPKASPTAAAGLLLVGATVAALVVANSPLAALYHATLSRPVAGLATIHWINDGLMALFFLLVGLEIKRELVVGGLSTAASRILPGAAAIAGMAVPALVYFALTRGDPAAQRGWAIPAATDIAFALAVLAVLGDRIPPALRVFLTAVAIIDDLGAIVVIGLFYTAQIHLALLAAAAAGLAVLIAFNRAGVRNVIPYLLVGAGVWTAVHDSGVHATLAGVAVALTIPLRDRAGDVGGGPLDRLEHALTPVIGFFVVPLFGFANAGVGLDRTVFARVAAPVPLAIIAALVIGKQTGVFGSVWLLARLGLATPPAGTTWRQVHGAALLCGIGFTMSLFIAALAFGEGSANDTMAKLGILIGSLVSAVAGYVALRTAR
jgi:NhaA family Na+:H+ antiporter